MKIIQIGMSPQIPETASATQAEDITRSEHIMIFFLSCRSISTPMNIPSTAWGRNPASVAKERTAADFVLPVIYHMIAICTMELVRVDIPWPDQIVKNFFLHPANSFLLSNVMDLKKFLGNKCL